MSEYSKKKFNHPSGESGGTNPSIEVLREFHVSGNEQRFENIISELKFLAKVKPNQKINVSTKEIVSSDQAQDRLYRTLLMVEGKKVTLDYVRQTVNNAIN